jgi:ferrochelatase
MSTGGPEFPYDAILIVGFGGPEKPDDVLPFLENVTRGRGIPRERLLVVAEHYHHFGGASPINAQVRALMAALTIELRAHGVNLPVYWGNRNWHPMLADTIQAMTDAGVRHALAVVLAAYSSYSSCRQYREDIGRAREAAGPGAPRVDKMRVFYNHPAFIATSAARVRGAFDTLSPDLRGAAHIAFTAHSIPLSMVRTCDYVTQLSETCRLVADAVGVTPERWQLVYQSRSGRPADPWLEPDILDHLAELKARGVSAVVVHPVGFLSDHLEVLYDLDVEARHKAAALGLTMVRCDTVGTDPQFVGMLRALIVERVTGASERAAIGRFGPNHDVCPADCCLPPARPGRG